MEATDEDKGFRTVRGAITGEESEQPIYFAYSASLRIFGNIPDLDELTRRFEISPTNTHKKGERRRPEAVPYRHDMWSYTAQVDEAAPLHVHIGMLWGAFRAHKDYLLQLKKQVTVDVFLGYRSNCDHAGIEIPHQSLAMFVESEVPFGVSIILT